MSSRRWIFRIQDIISAAKKVEKYINGMEWEVNSRLRALMAMILIKRFKTAEKIESK